MHAKERSPSPRNELELSNILEEVLNFSIPVQPLGGWRPGHEGAGPQLGRRLARPTEAQAQAFFFARDELLGANVHVACRHVYL